MIDCFSMLCLFDIFMFIARLVRCINLLPCVLALRIADPSGSLQMQPLNLFVFFFFSIYFFCGIGLHQPFYCLPVGICVEIADASPMIGACQLPSRHLLLHQAAMHYGLCSTR